MVTCAPRVLLSPRACSLPYIFRGKRHASKPNNDLLLRRGHQERQTSEILSILATSGSVVCSRIRPRKISRWVGTRWCNTHSGSEVLMPSGTMHPHAKAGENPRNPRVQCKHPILADLSATRGLSTSPKSMAKYKSQDNQSFLS